MSLLLDTHIALWWLADDATLAADVKDHIDREPVVFLSAATIWEVTIKQSLGKVGPPDLPERLRDCDLQHLAINAEHSIAAGRLPLHHRDPFARMLVAQAQTEGLTLVTRDAEIQKYDVPILVA
ncbi:type II toxin-antitoxin system VapC family toxin [Actinoplanes sp. NPDC089786]|uniref:type II toxin-antitoxin system VapC family toxin n=1 Tax=Actinoplanes sp. NPDC089786 TaxID=3155185 RepID=UPI00343055ED